MEEPDLFCTFLRIPKCITYSFLLTFSTKLWNFVTSAEKLSAASLNHSEKEKEYAKINVRSGLGTMTKYNTEIMNCYETVHNSETVIPYKNRVPTYFVGLR